MSVHNRFCLTLSNSWLLKALNLITSYNNREIRCCNPSISYVYRNIYDVVELYLILQFVKISSQISFVFVSSCQFGLG